jgi:predicted transcriptional regulator
VDCQLTQLELPIVDVFPNIFKRPLLHVDQSDPFLTVATFLALGPQIYVDGLVVLDKNRPVGVIGGRHTIEYILYHRNDFLKATASDIMSRSVFPLEATRPVNDAMEIFEKTGFAFVPITMRQKVVTSLSVRDMLSLAVKSKLETPVRALSSQAITVGNDASIGSAIELMLEQEVRSVIVRQNDKNTIINDRKILEYLVSHAGREVILSGGLEGLFQIDVAILEPIEACQVRNNMSASEAAERLLDINTSCLLLDNGSIVTPWDIVMKGLERPLSA